VDHAAAGRHAAERRSAVSEEWRSRKGACRRATMSTSAAIARATVLLWLPMTSVVIKGGEPSWPHTRRPDAPCSDSVVSRAGAGKLSAERRSRAE
jgi:hypothetical protein